MSKQNPKNRKRKLSQSLVLAALMSGGVLQPLLPALAASTAPGIISNTATATYEDDNNTTFDATSNTVEIRVAEVAGILAVPAGVNDTDGGAIQAGDELEYDFKVTNTGNTATDIFIPALTNITTENFDTSSGSVQYAIINSLTGAVGTFQARPGTGLVPNVAPGDSIMVRVTGTVPTTGLAAGTDIRVTLGNTGPNDNSSATQNQPDVQTPADTAAEDIRTVEMATGPAGAPINGEREASATQYVDFATALTPLALATVRKTVAQVAANGSSGSDDQITYGLSLTVENTSPNAAFTPEELAGTVITLDGSPSTRILISDAIPAGTKLDHSRLASLPALPTGWTRVYTNDPAATVSPLAAQWTATAPADQTAANAVSRVGFVYTADSRLPANGVAISGFQIPVVTSTLPASGGTVYNIAQVFGRTYDSPTNANQPVDQVIYDESGDSNPNNFNDNQTPPDATGSEFTPGTDTGVANPSTQGIDLNGNNTGVGPKGEVIQVTIGSNIGTSDDILNGPDGAPGAVGPTDTNDDFTNKSAPVSPGQQTAYDPAAVVYTNTVQNPATNTVDLSNVTIEPVSPTQAEGADTNSTPGKFGLNGDIPVNTVVTITFGSQTAEYTYNGTYFAISTTAGKDKPVNVGTLTPGQMVDYTVSIDFPEDATRTLPNSAISIPLLAFTDDDPTLSPGYNSTLNLADAANPDPLYVQKAPELNNNVTNDRVYLGFMKLVKEARIIDAAGGLKQDWSAAPTAQALPGEIIEYRIRYSNISTPAIGSGNVILNANNFVLTEDGAALNGAAPDNNWAASTTHRPSTLFDRGSVEYFQGTGSTTSLGSTDPAAGAQVGTYVNDVGSVAPGESGEFSFRRQVNQ